MNQNKGGLATLRVDRSPECATTKNEVEGWVSCFDCNGGETLYFTPKGLMELTSRYHQDDNHIWHKHPHTQSSHLCQIVF